MVYGVGDCENLFEHPIPVSTTANSTIKLTNLPTLWLTGRGTHHADAWQDPYSDNHPFLLAAPRATTYQIRQFSIQAQCSPFL